MASQKGKGTAIEPLSPEKQALDNAEVHDAIRDHCQLLASKVAERKVINTAISHSRTKLVDRGLNRKAMTIIEAVARMEDQHREGFAQTLILGLKSIGHPLQQDLFIEPEEEAPPPEEKAPQGRRRSKPVKPDLRPVQ